MILVVDTNRIIAALVRDSISRKILFSSEFKFVSLNLSRQEIAKYKEELLQKAGIDDEQFQRVLEILTTKTRVISDLAVQEHMPEAKKIMDRIDPFDTPFIAAALASHCGIWSDDEHFCQQTQINAWKTKDLIGLL